MEFNKRLLPFFSIFLFSLFVKGQDYSIIPINLDAQGTLGELILAKAKIRNNSSEKIEIFIERIDKDLPSDWTSCFCHPVCIAPFIDTLRYEILPFSEDSIMPNFGTNTIPGIGTIVASVYQVGFESVIDTITFTGSTLTSGIDNKISNPDFTVYPNPFNNTITLESSLNETYSVIIFNSMGKIILRKEKVRSSMEVIDMGFLDKGIYFVQTEFSPDKILTKKIFKSD